MSPVRASQASENPVSQREVGARRHERDLCRQALAARDSGPEAMGPMTAQEMLEGKPMSDLVDHRHTNRRYRRRVAAYREAKLASRLALGCAILPKIVARRRARSRGERT